MVMVLLIPERVAAGWVVGAVGWLVVSLALLIEFLYILSVVARCNTSSRLTISYNMKNNTIMTIIKIHT